VSISRNEIHGNGASGIYINASAPRALLPAGADVSENIIRDNGEWGIARSAAGAVNIGRNSVFGNNLYGIDYGLDLSTPDAPGKPVLTSATYDPARNVTIVRGTTNVPGAFGAFVDLYASSSLSRWGYPEAERWLKIVYNGRDFEAVIEEDLRGKWITATGTRVIDVLFLRDGSSPRTNVLPRYQANDTSELSDAIRVE
jgi:hypothetical protein